MTRYMMYLADKSPKELMGIKDKLCRELRFEDAAFVADFAQFCMQLKRVVKTL